MGLILPRLDAAILDAAAELGVPVVFPESVYAFAGLDSPITESSPFAPVEDKGRIRQRLLEARSAHSATAASVIAGDLLGRTAEKWSSVVRMCITEPVSAGRRAMVPARTDVPHGITVIADHAAAMIQAAEDLTSVPTGTHQLRIAPASNPTLAEIADFTADALGQKHKRPISVPRWATRAIGAFERSFYELNQLAPIWYEPCVISPATWPRLSERPTGARACGRCSARKHPRFLRSSLGEPDQPPRWIPLPGPSGRSKTNQMPSSTAQASQNGMTNGNIREITVPSPAFGS